MRVRGSAVVALLLLAVGQVTDQPPGAAAHPAKQPPRQLPLTPRSFFPYAVRNANPWKLGIPLAAGLPGYDAIWYRAREGLASDRVQAIARDPRGVIWFGTDRGAVALQPDGSLRTYTASQDGLAHDDVSAIVVDHQGEVWFGGNLFWGDGAWGAVSRFDGRDIYTWRNTGESGVSLGVIQAMAIDGDDNKWLATAPEWTRWSGLGPGGLIRLSGRYYGQTGWESWATGAGVSLRFSDDVVSDRRGNVWLLAGGRLARRDPSGTWTDVAAAEGQPEGTVQGLAVDPVTDALVVSTGTRYDAAIDRLPPHRHLRIEAADDALLWRQPGGGWRREEGSPASRAGRLAIDRSGNLWFARDPVDEHSAGVRWADGGWSYFGADAGPLARTVHEITVDTADEVWFGTAAGAVALRRR